MSPRTTFATIAVAPLLGSAALADRIEVHDANARLHGRPGERLGLTVVP